MEVNDLDYIEELRGILNRGVLNELNVGGKDIPREPRR